MHFVGAAEFANLHSVPWRLRLGHRNIHRRYWRLRLRNDWRRAWNERHVLRDLRPRRFESIWSRLRRRRGFSRQLRQAFATSRRAYNWNEVSTLQKKFARLRHDQTLSAELLFQAHGAAGGNHAQRIIQIEPDVDVANRPADIERRRNN